ncbi:NADP-dependent oxidoreductase [Frondihabitans sp. PAMC 28766]|uniref:NADP-dependent oxidoreductase n=1 Tax=Frondihabitans sp. PAMC 28766 TaxID=1795630 RepID=UPI00078BCB7A|nr:NADP-dependent oxidoreductase [Frondihabitans sp. PAMC 28766]AMM19550.1 NADP-dependent oxidoreductase [Frondihabitans sp. PAMC 28766]
MSTDGDDPRISTQWHLVRRPHGEPTADDVQVRRVELPALAEGEVRVRNVFLSVDPYMRGRMDDRPSYVPPFRLDEAMTGGAIGHVVESRDPAMPVGTAVSHNYGWRDLDQGPARAFASVAELPGVSLSVYLGALGMTGLTAYTGLTRIAKLKEGDSVFVSGAAGAVGSMVGQIARLKGASRVVGSAGSDAKVALLTERYGFDEAFNYRAGDIRGQLKRAAPDGIDVYFDNVGGEHLSAALHRLNRFGRVAVCGAISGYNSTGEEAGITGMTNIVRRSLRLEGFTMGDHWDLAGAFRDEVGPWVADGSIQWDETVVEGLSNAFDAFTRMMHGENVGKMVVAV